MPGATRSVRRRLRGAKRVRTRSIAGGTTAATRAGRSSASCRGAGVAAASEGAEADACGASTWRGAVRSVPLHLAFRAHGCGPAAGHGSRPPTRRPRRTPPDRAAAARVLQRRVHCRDGTPDVVTVAGGPRAVAMPLNGRPCVRDVRLVGLRRGVADGEGGRRREGGDV